MPSLLKYLFDTFGPITTFFGVSLPGVLCLKLIEVLVRVIKDPPPKGKFGATFVQHFFGNVREWLLWAALISITVSLLLSFLSAQAIRAKDEQIAILTRVLQGTETGSDSSADGRIRVHAYLYPDAETWRAQVEIRPTKEIWEKPVIFLLLAEQKKKKLLLGNGAIGGNPGLTQGVQQAPTEIKDRKWALFHREIAISPSDCLYIFGDELPTTFTLILTETNERLTFDLDQKTGQYLPALN